MLHGMYTLTHMHAPWHVHTHTHVCTMPCTHSHIHVHHGMYTPIYMHVPWHVHATYVYTMPCAHPRIHMHDDMCTHIHTHAPCHVHTHTYTPLTPMRYRKKECRDEKQYSSEGYFRIIPSMAYFPRLDPVYQFPCLPIALPAGG